MQLCSCETKELCLCAYAMMCCIHTQAQAQHHQGLTRRANNNTVSDLKASLSCPVAVLVKCPDIRQACMEVQGVSQNQGGYEEGQQGV